MNGKPPRNEARESLLAGCEKWIDQWDHTEGSVLTGWVVILETVRPDGTIDASWASGNGDRIGEDGGGLASHRVDALARQVSREIDAIEIRRYMRHEDG